MMLGLRKNLLSSFYKDSIRTAKNYLKDRYNIATYKKKYNEEVIEIKKNLPSCFNVSEFWELKAKGSYRIFTLIIALPKEFPDIFPRIYLSKKDYQEIYPVPHVDKKRFVCTRDSNVVVLNDKKPGEAVYQLINIAIGILESGIKKENQNHFIEEFLAYWDEGVKYHILSLYFPSKYMDNLKAFELSNKIFNSKYIIGNLEEVKKWIAPLNVNIKNNEIRVLYLPVSSLSPFSINNDKDILDILSKPENKENMKYVEGYFNQNIYPYIILSSFPLKEERILFGWNHIGWKNVTFKGFRKNHVPLVIRLNKTKKNQIEKIKINRVDKERIFKRGSSNTTLTKKGISVAIVGCGSLGSCLAMSLSKCGVSKFFLIDNEYLEVENVGRHLCGFLDASQRPKKVEAVKIRLIEHFPHIKCNTYFGDILKLLQTDNSKLDNYNLIVATMSNMSAERRMNYSLRKGFIKSPIIFLWMEPYGVGGHGLYIHRENGGCYECCFNNKGEFIFSISEPNQQFYKRESGCQSTFLPYSSLDIEHFISVICKKILLILEDEINGSNLFTWLGDLESFENLGFKTNDMYVTDFPFRFIDKRVLPSNLCRICGSRV